MSFKLTIRISSEGLFGGDGIPRDVGLVSLLLAIHPFLFLIALPSHHHLVVFPLVVSVLRSPRQPHSPEFLSHAVRQP